MGQLYRLVADASHSIEDIWNALESISVDILYSSEEGDNVEIFANISSLDLLSQFSWIKKIEPYELPPINWESQWAINSPHFHDGHLQLNFKEFGLECPSLILKPGSGFGDLSHPTTRLMLKMMAKHLHHETVIDIGCGSGILTLSSKVMGVQLAYGIDIDENALFHSIENALINHLGGECIFVLPSEFEGNHQLDKLKQPILILMNMIMHEQIVAWTALSSLHSKRSEVLTSGIRTEEREGYLGQVKQWGWKLKEEKEESGWLAFLFENN